VITATYPGASAKTLEDTVTAIIEQEMNGVENLLYMTSNSESSGLAAITVTFKSGTDINLAAVEVQNRLKRVEARLPEEVRRQGLRVDKAANNYLMFYTLVSKGGTIDYTALNNYNAAHVIDQIRRVPGVGDVNQFGPEYAMRVWLDPIKLTGVRLTTNDVLRAIREQNTQISAGEIGSLPSVPGQQLHLSARLPTTHSRGISPHGTVGTDERSLRRRQNRRHKNVRKLQQAIWDEFFFGDADESLRGTGQFRFANESRHTGVDSQISRRRRLKRADRNVVGKRHAEEGIFARG
jgi:multidrug efflux pump subunit AcrB